MGFLPEGVEELIGALSLVPGLGTRTARRMVLYLLSRRDDLAERLGVLLVSLRRDLFPCSSCGFITDVDPCRICSDPSRDRKLLCAVESHEDLIAIESAGFYRGLYHVLGGLISPLEGVFAEDLNLEGLLRRLDGVEELVLALSPRLEGDLTFQEILSRLGERPLRVSRLSFGLPVGGSVSFSDRATLQMAFESRFLVRG